MIIQRPRYMEKLIRGMGSGQVKIVTGVRRCGKSFLLFDLFKSHLVGQGVPESNIFEMAFDRFSSRKYRDPEVFHPYLTARLEGAAGARYVLLDEVQLLGDFAEVLIDLIAMEGVDVYVTGSNAKLLSKDVVTEFRGRGQEIAMAPLSFSEFMSAYDGGKHDGYQEYATYGGLPGIFTRETPEEKADYLNSLYKEVYLRDIVERNVVRDSGNLEELVDVLSSAIGSLTNASKLAATFKSRKGARMAPETVECYLSFLEDSFLLRRAKRYDVKGRRYISTPLQVLFRRPGAAQRSHELPSDEGDPHHGERRLQRTCRAGAWCRRRRCSGEHERRGREEPARAAGDRLRVQQGQQALLRAVRFRASDL